MRIYDTLTGQKREFAPVADVVRMYVCGVTPYAPAHVGHALSYIVFDMVRRYLEHRGLEVKHVQNFTDIDDKLIDRARHEGTTVAELAQRHIDGYFQDMDALNVRRASLYPRATEEIPRMVEIIAALVANGSAYPAGGDVYFRVRHDPSYGKLSNRTLDSMRAGARVEPGEQKEHPMDFALWKGAKPGEPQWNSPWGFGRPGWHIECTAMALSYLGDPVDIHGGGMDLVFPHHENEIAQSEAYTGHAPFVRFWLHNGLLHMDEEKMSKSLGNMVTVHQALERFSADALRIAVLSSHYRSPSTYSDKAMDVAQRAVARLRQAATLAGPEGAPEALEPSAYRDRFVAAMDDDFNTPQALAVLFDLARDINRAVERGHGVAEVQQVLLELGREVLGLTFEEKGPQLPPELEAQVLELMEQRSQLRAKGQYAEADHIREELARRNVTLTDTSSGTTWHWDGFPNRETP